METDCPIMISAPPLRFRGLRDADQQEDASILTVGCALTNRAVGSAATRMTIIAITIAATMTGMCRARVEQEYDLQQDDLGDLEVAPPSGVKWTLPRRRCRVGRST